MIKNVKDLKDFLERILADLENYDDEQKVEMVSNTYFLGHPSAFLGISGYDGGYINLDCPVDEDEDYDEEEW
jgi:hypothetical protein